MGATAGVDRTPPVPVAVPVHRGGGDDPAGGTASGDRRTDTPQQRQGRILAQLGGGWGQPG